MTDLVAAKARMRREARLRRTAAATASPQAAAALTRLALDGLTPPAGSVVAGYWPVGDEIDPLPLLTALAERWVCALPAVGEGRALVFRPWMQGAILAPGRYGIPTPSLDLPVILPDIVLMPMLAFDRSGHRLGYGGGHYDATLAILRAARPTLAVGLAYADQEVERVPADEWDQKLDLAVTELEIMEFDALESRR